MTIAIADRNALATEIVSRRNEIAGYATDKMYASPFWEMRYGPQVRITIMDDHLKTVDVFSMAVRNSSPMIAQDHTLWLRGLLVNLGLCTTYLAQTLTHLQAGGKAVLSPAAASAFGGIIDRCQRVLPLDNPICKTIAQHQDALVEVVVNTMYDNYPFWKVRYGEKGRPSSQIDTHYNLAYLSDAIGMNNAKTLLGHTKWMRDFLISRGMCSEHYITAWELLIEAVIGVLSPDQHATVIALRDALISNMRYQTPLEAAILSQRDTLCDLTARRHYDRSPSLSARFSRDAYMHDVHFKLGYLTDALCQNKPALIHDHLEWTRKVLPQLGFTVSDFRDQMGALADTLANSPAAAQPFREAQTRVSDPQAEGFARSAEAITNDVWTTLHSAGSFWSFQPNMQGNSAKPRIRAAVDFVGDSLTHGDTLTGLRWLNTEARNRGASAAYMLDFVEALQTSARARLPAETATKLATNVNKALDALTESDSSLALLRLPKLVDPVIDHLQSSSPYWQSSYQRRSRAALMADVRSLVGILADEIGGQNQAGWMTAVDVQHRYLLTQGICTAYYQQMIDLVTDALKSVLDNESAEQVIVLLDAANASLESDNTDVLALAAVQDKLVDFVIQHLQNTNPSWVSAYPKGWDDAQLDFYYWLGYLTDALTFNNAELLASHIGWLYQLASGSGGSAEHIQVSLVALGHAIKTQLPDHAAKLLGVMRVALSRISAS